MSIASFFNTYFVLPILTGSGYNIYNTITYAFIFIIFSIIVYKLLRKMGISIDERFIFASIPFILLGGFLRASEDIMEAAGFGRNIFLITPLVYFVVFITAFSTLLIIKSFTKKYHKPWFFVGIVSILAISSSFIYAKSFIANAFLLMSLLSLFWVALIFCFNHMHKFFSRINSFVLSSHMFDATTTFVALSNYSYFEQHVFTGFLINIFGPAVIFIVKFVVVSLVLFIFDKNFSKHEKNYLKFIILLLGLGPGVRNFIRIIAGV